MTDVRTLAGSCHCGAVQFEVADAFEYALNCHCSKCRRATGSAFKPFGGIAIADFRITKGADNLGTFPNASVEDRFCRTCGSLLYSVAGEGQFAHVCYGTLTDAPTLTPQSHIYVGSKASWYPILDALPQHDTHPGAES